MVVDAPTWIVSTTNSTTLCSCRRATTALIRSCSRASAGEFGGSGQVVAASWAKGTTSLMS